MAEILAIVFIFGWPGIFLAMWMIRGQFNERLKRRERADARRMYERLMHRKLDVVESALAMGYSRDELAQLDQRLEGLIGAQQMRSLLDKAPTAPELRELKDDDRLREEIAAIRRTAQRQ